MTFRAAGFAAILVLAAMAAPAQQAADAVAPETAAPAPAPAAATHAGLGPGAREAQALRDAGRPATGQSWMISAANPLAVQAGAKILEAGGSAADAMIATQAVLGLVEPQSSGLGGGAFLVWYDAASGTLATLDGRETAPMAATPTLFQDMAGQPMGFMDAVVGGRSVGTPGTPALMKAAHERWGRKEWPGLFLEAINLADQGFPVSPRLAGLVAENAASLARFPATAAYFLPGGTPLESGSRLANPAYARTLRALAAGGTEAFYKGAVAQGIVDTVQQAQDSPGLLSLDDLAVYRVKERPPVCIPYRAAEICGMGPPSSGGLTVGQILGMLENFDLAAMGPDSARAWRLIGDASRLAFADRGLYMADSDFVPMPTAGLTDPDYLRGRAELLAGAETALPSAAPGRPEFDHAMLWGAGDSPELPSTSHISIVDQYGNALSMTTTIENGFGSRLMTPGGFLLNNELTDFSFRSHEEGRPVANRVEPGKRPRSSMAPTIVMKEGKPVYVTGSPGGSRIIGYVAQNLIEVLDWGRDPQAAAAAPHLVNRFGRYDIEAGTPAETLAGPLRDLGFDTETAELNSGIHAIAITPDGLLGGADPRREGIAIGK
ncbi:gamma-glutamyltransferase [Mangrovicoccus algicola]|uniref:Glutathione hydrolase proenzyme n=1 Tax=Mangrovicoccus algicola TaxID=2771008 RepID=A0A8J6YYR7_9RHOB|nr:gamma-glutamyltransferase [Mangrovicoccus algicola]MBE3640282.1 gamma-glutamyltransferase [Mangrovicoccus algicola]